MSKNSLLIIGVVATGLLSSGCRMSWMEDACGDPCDIPPVYETRIPAIDIDDQWTYPADPISQQNLVIVITAAPNGVTFVNSTLRVKGFDWQGVEIAPELAGAHTQAISLSSPSQTISLNTAQQRLVRDVLTRSIEFYATTYYDHDANPSTPLMEAIDRLVVPKPPVITIRPWVCPGPSDPIVFSINVNNGSSYRFLNQLPNTSHRSVLLVTGLSESNQSLASAAIPATCSGWANGNNTIQPSGTDLTAVKGVIDTANVRRIVITLVVYAQLNPNPMSAPAEKLEDSESVVKPSS